ncbi:hypothetical protein LDENG_00102090, partial [Lucifuga dentata]
MEVWKVGKTFLIHRSSSMLWEMIVSNVTCMKTEYIRLKHAKQVVWSFKMAPLITPCRFSLLQRNYRSTAVIWLQQMEIWHSEFLNNTLRDKNRIAVFFLPELLSGSYYL